MRFVTDQHVENIRLGHREVVEVPELHASARADDTAQVLGEGLRPRDVLRGETLSTELAEQVHRDDGLPCARTAVNEDRRLACSQLAGADLRQHGVEDDLLLVEEHEGRLGRDHARRVVE